MLKYCLHKLLETFATLLIIISLLFFLTRLIPGGPFDGEKAIPDEILREIEKHYGLDKPVWEQYVSYLGNLLQGDLGPSLKHAGWTVNELIADKFLVSLELGLYALLIAIVLGVLLGTCGAAFSGTALDYTAMFLAVAGICLPSFVMGPVLLKFFALEMNWFSVAGWELPQDKILPSLTLGLIYAAFIARLLRASLLEEKHQAYIRTARAKGLSENKIFFKHALRNAIQPVLSFLPPAVAGLITGSFVVESIFYIPGMGKFFVNSVINRDTPLILGTVLIYGSLLILLNLICDLTQAAINPRRSIS